MKKVKWKSVVIEGYTCPGCDIEQVANEGELSKGLVITCKHCGETFILSEKEGK